MVSCVVVGLFNDKDIYPSFPKNHGVCQEDSIITGDIVFRIGLGH
jgi:hypothetical protein